MANDLVCQKSEHNGGPGNLNIIQSEERGFFLTTFHTLYFMNLLFLELRFLFLNMIHVQCEGVITFLYYIQKSAYKCLNAFVEILAYSVLILKLILGLLEQPENSKIVIEKLLAREIKVAGSTWDS